MCTIFSNEGDVQKRLRRESEVYVNIDDARNVSHRRENSLLRKAKGLLHHRYTTLTRDWKRITRANTFLCKNMTL